MFVSPNTYWYEKFEDRLTAINNDRLVAKPLRTGNCKRCSER